MTFSGRTYLFSFTGFVVIFLGLGLYFGTMKIRDHLLAKAFLDAVPLQARVVEDGGRHSVRWDVSLTAGPGVSARLTAGAPDQPVAIRYSDDPGGLATPGWPLLPVGPSQRVEDLRLDSGRGILYLRLRGRSGGNPPLETTWLCTFDLGQRRLLRKISINPAQLPPAFLP